LKHQVVGGLLLALAAVVWLALVPASRERARALASQRLELEGERDALRQRVRLLEGERGLIPAHGAGSGPVALRAAVVSALQGLEAPGGVRLDVSGDPGAAAVRLAFTAELDAVLGVTEALAHPRGPLVLTQVAFRPAAEGVALQLSGLQLGATP
jgi:hypothetical protein